MADVSVFDEYKVITWRDRLAAKLAEFRLHRTKRRCESKWLALQTASSMAEAEKEHKPDVKYLRLYRVITLWRDHDNRLRTTHFFFQYDLDEKAWAVRIELHSSSWGYSSSWASPSESRFWYALDGIEMNDLLKSIEYRETSQY